MRPQILVLALSCLVTYADSQVIPGKVDSDVPFVISQKNKYSTFRNKLNLSIFGKPSLGKKVEVLDNSFEDWVQVQKTIAFQGVLNNIGGISENLDIDEVVKGGVIASPSKSDPDYFYQWTRDAALTIKTLIYYIEDHRFEGVENIKLIIEAYIKNNYYLQRLDNRSGKFDDADKSGLGEPKFLATNKVFSGNWGRPQRDGPGLRVITVLSYLALLDKYKENISDTFLQSRENIYHEIVKPDLIYVLRNWHKEGFDLWEEVNSQHFFGSITQLRALKEGIAIAETINGEGEFIKELKGGFDALRSYVEVDSGFSSSSVPYIVETPALLKSGKRSGLDAAILLGSIHSHNAEAGNYSDIPFDVYDGKILNTLSALVSDMKYRYPINHNRIGFKNLGVALGRYPEDIYDGHGTSEGNPWFLVTACAAEVVYKFVYKLNSNKENIIINANNSDFFKDFNIENAESGIGGEIVIHYGSTAYSKLTRELLTYSDSFLKTIKDHVDGYGHMSEQFNKDHGYMQGARDLTWSYSAFWNAVRWREKASSIVE